jgi:hypothetical protein
MPKFKVTIDGKSYAVTVPEGQGPQQAYAYARQAQTNAAPKTPMQRLGSDLATVATGFAKGPFSLVDMGAQGLGALLSLPERATAYLADKAGAKGAASYFRSNADQLSHPFTAGGAIEAIRPTPQDANSQALSLAAQITTGGAPLGRLSALTNPNILLREAGVIPKNVPANFRATPRVAPKTIPGAREVVKEAEKAGVRVMTSDVRPPRTFASKTIQTIGERIPYTGTGGARQAQQVERMNAVRDLMHDYGAAAGDDIASPAIDNVMSDLMAKRGGELKQLTAAKNSVIEKFVGSVPVSRTIAAIDQEIASLDKVGTAASRAIVGKLQNWRQAIQVIPKEVNTGVLDASGKQVTRTVIPESKNLSTIELIRKEMGEAFKDPNLAGIRSVGEKALSRIYGPMREDMGAFIKSQNPGDFVKWKAANDRLASMAGDLKINSIKSVLNAGEETPEKVASMLFSTKASEIRRLHAGLTEAGRAHARTAILQRALEKSGGMDTISPEKFVSQVRALDGPIGTFFGGDDLARVQGLSRVLRATQRASVAGVNPPTGAQNAIPILAAVLTDAMGGAGAAITTGGIAGLTARAYESAAVRNTLLALSKTKPGSPGERMLMDRAARAIAAVAANSTRSTAPATALNDNLMKIGSVAASPDQRPDQPNQ